MQTVTPRAANLALLALAVAGCVTAGAPVPSVKSSGDLVSAGSGAKPARTRGYGPWKLGMSREAVRRVETHGPYAQVAKTGGLETRRGFFEGEPRTVSLVFSDQDALKKIQVWVYEGRDPSAAAAAWARLYSYLQREYGPVETPDVESDEALPADVLQASFERLLVGFVEASEAMGGENAMRTRFQMAPRAMPDDQKVWASLFADSQHGFFVFLFHTPRSVVLRFSTSSASPANMSARRATCSSRPRFDGPSSVPMETLSPRSATRSMRVVIGSTHDRSTRGGAGGGPGVER